MDNHRQRASLFNDQESTNEPDSPMPLPVRRQEEPNLLLKQKLGYSVGHVLNDLCSAIWFTYLLVFMTLVIQFTNQNAGILLLIGQIADGLSTPLVGVFSDKINIFNYGRKKSWHLIGTFCVIVSFPLIFDNCIFHCNSASPFTRLSYYSVFIIIFQFGWAATQISHLSLIPDLTPDSNERIGLNSLRFSWTVISNITVYVITWLVLSVDTNSSSASSVSLNPRSNFTTNADYYYHHLNEVSHDGTIGPKDSPKFRKLVISILALGAFFSALFHVFVKEPSRSSSNSRHLVNANDDDDDDNVILVSNNHLKWRDWFSIPQFYFVALLYMGTRLVINLTQVYIPFYLHFTLDLRKESIAYIPLIMYCSSFLTSLFTKYIDTLFGKKIMYGLGGLISTGSYIWIWCGDGKFFNTYGIFFVVILLGLSGAFMLVTSLGFTNDLIGPNTSSGAFVFGAFSFLDKVSNGVAVMIIQKLHPTDDPSCGGHVEFYRNVLTLTCGSATLIALFSLCLLIIKPITTQNKKQGDLSDRQICVNDEENSDCDPLIA